MKASDKPLHSGWTRKKVLRSFFSFSLCAGAFLYDWITPLGVAGGLVYIVFVLSGIWFRRASTVFVFAGISTVLTTFGYFYINDIATSHFWVELNRIMTIVVLWVVAALAYFMKRADRQEGERENRLQAIMDNTVDGLITIDGKGRIETFNKACETIFGYDATEVVGKNVKILMPEPYHAEHDRYLKNYRDTGEKKIIGIGREVEGKRKNGTVFPLDLSVSEVNVEGRRLYSGIVRDITELQETQKRLAAILNNTVDGLITIDGEGRIETFNKACETIFGYDATEVIGKNVKVLMPEPYHAEHDGYLKNYHSTGEKKIIGIGREVQGKRKDGTIFSIDLSVSEVNVEGRRLYSGIVRDITERKEAEAQRETLIGKLSESNEELERFAYVASHDLQEPLRMVTNFTGLLEKRYGDQLDEQAREYIDFSASSAKRMQELVDDLLEYARIGEEAERYEDVKFNALIDLLQENLQTSIDASGAVITHDELPTLPGNPIRMLRLFQNLVGNSLKYRKPDVVPEIHIGAKEENGEWVFTIKDNGIGMKPEYCQKIFEPFKRLHGKSEYSGTGMGLAICRKIVEGAGGKIWVKSYPGKGSKFYFTIPAQTMERKEAA